MSGIDLAIDNLKGRNVEMRQKLTAARKKGVDVSIATLKSLNVQAKIGLAEATKDSKDVKKVIEVIDEVEKEIEEAIALHEHRKSGEKEAPAKSYDDLADSLSRKIGESIAKNDRESMKKCYVELRGVYQFLSPEKKKEMYKKSVELYSALGMMAKRGQ